LEKWKSTLPIHIDGERRIKNMELIQTMLINFIMLGLFYSLIALGLALIFGVMEVLNFAHGQMYVLGGFVLFYFYGKYHVNYFVSLIICGVLLAALGFLFEKFLFRQVIASEKVTHSGSFLLALGTSLLLEEGALLAFGEKARGVPPVIQGIAKIGSMSVSYSRLLVIVISLFLILALFYFLNFTKIGRAMRAMTQDKETASLQGINVRQLSSLGFCLGAALAGIAGGVMSPVVSFSAGSGGPITTKVFIILLIGGFGSLVGAIAGGFVLGFLEAVGFALFPSDLVMLIIYAVVFLMLMFRPRGLMGKVFRE